MALISPIHWYKFACVILENLLVAGVKFMIIHNEVLSFVLDVELTDITI
jgi:hypothetical protein